jgi:acetylornithine/succinyldiaminopimelate/putrescine aminotransferase
MAGLDALPALEGVRGRGLMVGFDLRDGGAPELARRALLKQRLVVGATGPRTIRLEPPLVIAEDDVDEALSRLQSLL